MLYVCYKSQIKATIILTICYPTLVLLPFPPFGFYTTSIISLLIISFLKTGNIFNRDCKNASLELSILFCLLSCAIPVFIKEEHFSFNV